MCRESRTERGVNVLRAGGLAVALDLPDHVVRIAPQQPVRGDLLGAHVLAGIDPGEELLLSLVLDRLAPVLHESADVGRKHLLAHLPAVGAEPGVAPQHPVSIVTAGLRSGVPVDLQTGLRLGDRLDGSTHPRVAEPSGAVDGDIGYARDPQQRVRTLHRTRVDGQLGERPEPAVERGVLVLPDQPQDGQRLFHPGAALFEDRALHLVFGSPPAKADSQRNASRGQLVDGGHLLGDAYRVVHRQLEDAGADPQGAGSRGDGGHEGQRIGGIARHEVVMADGGGVEAGLLRLLCQLEGLGKRITGRLVAKDGKRQGELHFVPAVRMASCERLTPGCSRGSVP